MVLLFTFKMVVLCKPLPFYFGPWLLRSINDYMSERVNIIYCRNKKRMEKIRS